MTRPSTRTIFLILLILVMSGVVGVGLWIDGSPWRLREQRIDAKRVEHLINIQNAVLNYTERYERIPDALEDLTRDPNGSSLTLIDPISKEPYLYRSLSTSTIELCATFHTSSSEQSVFYPPQMAPHFWEHPAGKKCYTIPLRSSYPLTKPYPSRL